MGQLRLPEPRCCHLLPRTFEPCEERPAYRLLPFQDLVCEHHRLWFTANPALGDAIIQGRIELRAL